MEKEKTIINNGVGIVYRNKETNVSEYHYINWLKPMSTKVCNLVFNMNIYDIEELMFTNSFDLNDISFILNYIKTRANAKQLYFKANSIVLKHNKSVEISKVIIDLSDQYIENYNIELTEENIKEMFNNLIDIKYTDIKLPTDLICHPK